MTRISCQSQYSKARGPKVATSRILLRRCRISRNPITFSLNPEDEDRYIVLAQPLTACSACPTCGSTALVKNGRDDSCVHDLPAQGRHVLIQVKRQRYFCKDCRTSCSQPLPDVDARRNMTARLVEYIHKNIPLLGQGYELKDYVSSCKL